MTDKVLRPPSGQEETLPELMDLHTSALDEQCPMDYRVIADRQKAEIPKKIYEKSRSIKVGPITLKVNRNEQVMIPESLRQPLMKFYHDNLRHPGVVRMTNSLWINFAWSTLKEDVTEFVKYYDECQRFKKSRKHYTAISNHPTLVPIFPETKLQSIALAPGRYISRTNQSN
jgi:hypothetical protein